MDKDKKEFLDNHIKEYFTGEQAIVIKALVDDVILYKEKLIEAYDRINEQTKAINAIINDNESIVNFLNSVVLSNKESVPEDEVLENE